MHEAFIEGGMHTVTPETQAKLLSNWMNLSLATWPDDEEGSNAQASKVEDFAKRMPYREDKAKAVVNSLSDADFEKLPAAAKQKVMGGLFDPLDIESKLNVVDALLKKRQRQKASAALDDLQRMLEQMKDGSYTGLRPDQLTSAMGSGKESVITPREIAAFETRIKEFDEVFLTQMPVDALGATAKAESELEAARELIGPNQKPRPPGEGERKALRRQVEDAIVRAELVFSELGRSAGVLKMARDKREVARCIKELHASMTELKKLVVLYAG